MTFILKTWFSIFIFILVYNVILGHSAFNSENYIRSIRISFKINIHGAQQKVFVLEDTEVRENANGTNDGVTTAVAKHTNYNTPHELYVPEKYIENMRLSVKRSIFLKGYSQKHDGTMSISESSKVRKCFQRKGG